MNDRLREKGTGGKVWGAKEMKGARKQQEGEFEI